MESVTAGGRSVNYQYNTLDLSQITTANGVIYNFAYDRFGRITQIKMTDVLLSTTTYKDNYSSLVSRVDYANGTYKTYSYDNYDRLISESVNGVQTATYMIPKQASIISNPVIMIR